MQEKNGKLEINLSTRPMVVISLPSSREDINIIAATIIHYIYSPTGRNITIQRNVLKVSRRET